MKIALLLAALLFIGTLGALNKAIAADGSLSKDQSTAGSYGDEKVTAKRPNTPSAQSTISESAKTGASVDSSDPWYGFTSTDWGYRNPK